MYRAMCSQYGVQHKMSDNLVDRLCEVKITELKLVTVTCCLQILVYAVGALCFFSFACDQELEIQRNDRPWDQMLAACVRFIG